MIRLIINADDFGYSRAVNYGIIDAYKIGLLTSTTMMTNMPGTDHGVILADENPGLGVGVHLVLTCGRPLLKNHKTIVDGEGNFRELSFYEKMGFQIDLEEVYREWKEQIERFLSFGLIPTHLDSHHHVNAKGDIYKVFLRLAREYGLPVRNNMNKEVYENGYEYRRTDVFVGEVEKAILVPEKLIRSLEENSTIEIMCHPAYVDNFLLRSSSFVYPRLEELELLTDDKIVNEVKGNKNIKLMTYREL